MMVAALTNGAGSPQRFVAATYQRSPGRDLDGGIARAYTSSRPPTVVAKEITDKWRPADRRADGSGIYLRYADDVITIVPAASGSLILIEGTRSAFRRYAAVV